MKFVGVIKFTDGHLIHTQEKQHNGKLFGYLIVFLIKK